MRHFSHLSLLLMVAALATAAICTDKQSNQVPDPLVVRNLDRFAPEAYWELWKGDLTLPDQFPSNISEEQWLDLVAEADSAADLKSMSEPRRRTLLIGAAKTYLLSVGAAQFRLETDGGEADITEAYERDDAGLYVNLREREQRSVGIQTEWPNLANRDLGFSGTIREFIDNAAGSYEYWMSASADAGNWRCNRQEDAPLGFGSAVYYFQVMTMIDAAPGETRKFGETEVLVMRTDHGEEVWLDSATFFPVYFHFAEGVVEGPERTLRTLALNPEVQVQRPGDCTSAE